MSVSIASSGIRGGIAEMSAAASNVAKSNAMGSIAGTFNLVSQGPYGGVQGKSAVRDDAIDLQLISTGRGGDIMIPNDSRAFFVFAASDTDKTDSANFVFGRTASFDLDQDGILRYQGKMPLGFKLDNNGKPIGGTSFTDLKKIVIDRNSLSPAEVVSQINTNFRFDSSDAPLPTCGYQVRSDVFTSNPSTLDGKSILVSSIKDTETGRIIKNNEFIFSGFKISNSAYVLKGMTAGTKLLEVNGTEITLTDAIDATTDTDVSAMNKIIKSINASTLLNASMVDDGTSKKFFLGTDSQQSIAIANLAPDLGVAANFSINATPPGRTRFSSVEGLGKLLSGVGISTNSKNKNLLKILPDRNTSVSITNSSSSDVLSLLSLDKSDQGFMKIAYSSSDQRYSINESDSGVMSETIPVIDPEGGRRLIRVLSKKVGIDQYIAEASLIGVSSSKKSIIQAGVMEMGQDGKISSIEKAPNDVFANTGVKFSDEAFPISVESPPGEIYIDGQKLTHGNKDDIGAKTFATPQGLAQLVTQATNGGVKAAFLSDSAGNLMIRFRLSGNYVFSDNQSGAMLTKLGMPQSTDLKSVDILGKDGGTNIEWDSPTSKIQSTKVIFNVFAEKSSGVNPRIKIDADGRGAGQFKGWHIGNGAEVIVDYDNGAKLAVTALAIVEQDDAVGGWSETDSGFYKGLESTMSIGIASSFGITILNGIVGGGGANVIGEMISLNSGANLASASAAALRTTQDTNKEVLNKTGS
ncbi:flagellar hook protein FlgE [Candidatus Cyrtobacter comes]|uniref:Flagellar hook protein FlgE n=1 Tax=Candidatus Cyrtobacter comes TaxID=675776 RepID=A0ABU5L7D4_9RICK|nr:hypothetical protein [Candidatus Cyrtobacter comes]MDZ5762038.1 flagellar hook protein FlgE [Candidatus Cyrtobacter comes]